MTKVFKMASSSSVDEASELESTVDAVMKDYIGGVYRWDASSYERREGYKNFLTSLIQNSKKKDFHELGRQALDKHWKEYQKTPHYNESAPHFIYRLPANERHPHIYRLDSRAPLTKFSHPEIDSAIKCGYVGCPRYSDISTVISVVCNSSCQMTFHVPCYSKHVQLSGILCTKTPWCFALWSSIQVYSTSPQDFLALLKIEEGVKLGTLECTMFPLSGEEENENDLKKKGLSVNRRMQVMRPDREFEREAEIVRDILGAKVNDPHFNEIMNSEVVIRAEESGSPQPKASPKRIADESDHPLLTINEPSPPRKNVAVIEAGEAVQNSPSKTVEKKDKCNSFSEIKKPKDGVLSCRWTRGSSSDKVEDKSIGTPKAPTAENGTETNEVKKADVQTETFIRSSVAIGIQTGRVRLQDYLISNHQLSKLDEEFMSYRYEEFNARSKLLKAAANTSLENGRIQVVRSNTLINAYRLMINELRQQRLVSPYITDSLRSYLRAIVNYRNDVERWIGEVEERCYAFQSNENFIQPILECSLEFILGLFPVPVAPEIDSVVISQILNEIFVTGFLNYNDTHNVLIRELVEEAVKAFPIAGRDAVIWCIYHIRRKVEYLDGLNMRHILQGVLTEFTETILRESRRLVVYIT